MPEHEHDWDYRLSHGDSSLPEGYRECAVCLRREVAAWVVDPAQSKAHRDRLALHFLNQAAWAKYSHSVT